MARGSTQLPGERIAALGSQQGAATAGIECAPGGRLERRSGGRRLRLNVPSAGGIVGCSVPASIVFAARCLSVMIRKFAPVAAAGLFLLLAGCNQGNSAPDSSSQSATPTTSSSSDSGSTADTEAPATVTQAPATVTQAPTTVTEAPTTTQQPQRSEHRGQSGDSGQQEHSGQQGGHHSG